MLNRNINKFMLFICCISITLCVVQTSFADRETRSYSSTIIITEGVVTNGDTWEAGFDFGRIVHTMEVDGFDPELGDLAEVWLKFGFFTSSRFPVKPWEMCFLCCRPVNRSYRSRMATGAELRSVGIVEGVRVSIRCSWDPINIDFIDDGFLNDFPINLDFMDVSTEPPHNPRLRNYTGPWRQYPSLLGAVSAARGKPWQLEFQWHPYVKASGWQQAPCGGQWVHMPLRVPQPNDPQNLIAYAIQHGVEVTYIWTPHAPPDPTSTAPIAPLLLLD
jgi:hypothetical protein